MKNKHLAILLLLALAAGSGGCSTQPSSSQPAPAAQEVQTSTAPVIQADSQAYSDEGLKNTRPAIMPEPSATSTKPFLWTLIITRP